MQLHRYICVLDPNPDSILPYYSYHRNRITSEKGQQGEEDEEDEEEESDESNLNLTDQLHNTNQSNNTIPNYLYTSVGKPLVARCTWKIIVQDNVGGSSGIVGQKQQKLLAIKANRCCCCCCSDSTYAICCHNRAPTRSATFL